MYDRIERMRLTGPEFISIAWLAKIPYAFSGRCSLTRHPRRADRGVSDVTLELVKTCQGIVGIETCMHLASTNMAVEVVDYALRVGIFAAQTLPEPT